MDGRDGEIFTTYKRQQGYLWPPRDTGVVSITVNEGMKEKIRQDRLDPRAGALFQSKSASETLSFSIWTVVSQSIERGNGL